MSEAERPPEPTVAVEEAEEVNVNLPPAEQPAEESDSADEDS